MEEVKLGKEEEKKGDSIGNGAASGVYEDAVDLGLTTRLPSTLNERRPRTIFENLTWLKSNEAAEYLRLPSVGALRMLVFERRIPFHKLGRSLRFKKIELDRLLEASRNGGI